MNKRLFVGGIPWAATEDELRSAFEKAGTIVDLQIRRDPTRDNQSKGFGFVEMATDEEAQAAIDLLNGKDFQGRTLTVNEARPMRRPE
ncbi:MAG: RNA-binding protein [Candidatus Zambryskibacteria bacterium RIFCSPHIGHO2_01_FULL_43_25]|uniref:RNA-binding protein n=1 Tax=Candidatus Zambryskibacteria bacterium RIFCSPLOWO2_01_FULL_45_21 TaxID=1802761 RepID=A0A1G2U5S5_9BACT|nr:MAG: RNA-binding protein [Candidatus Zambryskibacteria bacterium RIFCSPHIGHO2_01_FULL_43_25]OHB00426.1 MAG: RNA-binding protein [Candidatus Zambryskibacteria bacterium RIFCSPHIGHO2_12_FULL_44_12b]OHB04222.1 MAG: RNA-binding protein [Candidatus Zambryskibacteria bacterium RIFCSPLOWO2_01_FULL_45_21]